MAPRVDLQRKLEGLLGSTNVYFQPPDDTKLQYPCIVYHLDGATSDYASNTDYRVKKFYQVTYIDRRPDSVIVDALITYPYSSLNSTMRVEGLNHYVFRIYH